MNNYYIKADSFWGRSYSRSSKKWCPNSL